jgi:hypothetical protein
MQSLDCQGQCIVFRMTMLTSMVLSAGCMADGAERTPTKEKWVGGERVGPRIFISQCGTGCPHGYHVTEEYCDAHCVGYPCFNSHNASTCEETLGPRFHQCGLRCPAGYHAPAEYCDANCSGYPCIDSHNASVCEQD